MEYNSANITGNIIDCSGARSRDEESKYLLRVLSEKLEILE